MRCPVLVGRDQEVGLVSEAVGKLSGGRGSTMLLLGEAGIGKTRLVEFGASAARRAGARVLIGRALPELATSPFRPLAEALLDLTRESPPPADDTFAPFVPVLATLLPHWRSRDWRPPEEPLIVMAEAVFQVLRRVCAMTGGVLIIFEDLHWADDSTLAVMRFLADHVDDAPLALLATARTDEGRDDIARLLEPTQTRVLHLTRLSPTETKEMVVACLGTGSTTVADIDQVAAHAEGLPLLVEDLLEAAPRRGLPRRFSDTVRARVNRLDANERRVLSAAAVLGQRFDWRLLPDITGLSLDCVASALQRCASLQLVLADNGAFVFRHALTREIVQAEGSTIEYQQLCVAAARTVAQTGSADDIERGLAVGRLLTAGGERQQAARVFLEVGRRALAQGMVSATEPALRQGTELVGPDSSLGIELRHALARTLLKGGHPEGAADTATQVVGVAELSDSELATDLRLVLARAAIATGHWANAQADLQRAKRVLSHQQAAAEIALLEATVALGTSQPGFAVVAEHQASAAVGIARHAGRPDLECEALVVLGLCARLRDLNAAADALDRALRLARSSGLPAQMLDVMNELGSVEMLRDARADRLEEARNEALRVGALGLAASIGLNLAAARVMTARFQEALQLADEVLHSASRLGLVPLQAAANLMYGFVMAHRGRGRDMDRHLSIAEALAPDDADLRAGAWGIGRGLHALLQEDRVGARRALARARLAAPLEHSRILNPYEGPELLLRTISGEADIDEVQEALNRSVRGARWPALWINSALAVARGARGDAPGANEALSAGLEAGAPYPVFCALAQRLVGEAALRDGWGEPEPLIRSAEATFTRLGLGRAASACRALLKTAGRPAPRRLKHETPLHPTLMAAGVTPKEAEVLELLADRLSNREIAERLYLSPRTVEKHVAALLDKLAVSRAELTRLSRTLQ